MNKLIEFFKDLDVMKVFGIMYFVFIAIYLMPDFTSNTRCSVSGVGFHMDRTIAIKFNSDGRFSYSDYLLGTPKSFWGNWKQKGNQIITINDRSTTGLGIGQQNIYTYDCNKLTIGGFTLVKD